MATGRSIRRALATAGIVAICLLTIGVAPAYAGTVCNPSLTGWVNATWSDGTASIVNARSCELAITGKDTSLANASLDTSTNITEFAITSQVRTSDGTIRASTICDVFGSFTSGHECDVSWIHSPSAMNCVARTYVTVFFSNGSTKITNPVISPLQGCG